MFPTKDFRSVPLPSWGMIKNVTKIVPILESLGQWSLIFDPVKLPGERGMLMRTLNMPLTFMPQQQNAPFTFLELFSFQAEVIIHVQQG